MIPKPIPLKSEALFKLAMRHRSAAENSVTDSYERLEFYGDAVLGLVIAQYLYEHHADWDQGMMSKARASVVQEAPLADRALALGLDQLLELGPGEESTGGRNRPGILCDIFEAIIGAIYIESGLEKARWFVLEQLDSYLMQISSGDVSPNDFKSRLQEISQALWRKTPTYRVSRENGFAHEKRFTVSVVFDDDVISEGTGRSKKEAEQAAAKDALEIIEHAQRSRKMLQEQDLEI
ncbi:ribonuclease III [bacterium]|jgi:ribonuclease-3|nr:ribonuclease III [Armatimonadetes bacterium Uphvl-Ar1]MBA4294215.1 ribonuclease III [bacterium]